MSDSDRNPKGQDGEARLGRRRERGSAGHRPMTRPLRLIANDGLEPPQAGIDRMLLLKLSEHRAALANLRKIEADLMPLRRAYADYRGEKMLPGIDRLWNEVRRG